MIARVIKIKYIPPGNESYIESGYGRSEYPKNCLSFGGNGTYRIVYNTPADIIVVVLIGDEMVPISIGNDVKRICTWCKLTRRRAELVINAMPSNVDVVCSENKRAISDESLHAWLSDVV